MSVKLGVAIGVFALALAAGAVAKQKPKMDEPAAPSGPIPYDQLQKADDEMSAPKPKAHHHHHHHAAKPAAPAASSAPPPKS